MNVKQLEERFGGLKMHQDYKLEEYGGESKTENCKRRTCLSEKDKVNS